MARCECGVVITGKDEDEPVAGVFDHIDEAHPGVSVTREQILSMAEVTESQAPED
jgi:predicted small metal-binding protein